MNSALVVPCFNEEARLDHDAFLALAGAPGLRLLFVDDGSSDGTARVLEGLRSRAPERVGVLLLSRNGGKGEAVRRGMLEALAAGADVVGFADADLATPPDELIRIRDALAAGDWSVAVGSRVMLMGSRIERHVWRHFVGRVFATLAANILRMPFYDTQCGAKFFRDTPSLRAALAHPFLSRWAFDIELLGRLRIGADAVPGLRLEEFLEVPLHRWISVSDSKLTLGAMSKTLLELPKIERELARLRALGRGPQGR